MTFVPVDPGIKSKGLSTSIETMYVNLVYPAPQLKITSKEEVTYVEATVNVPSPGAGNQVYIYLVGYGVVYPADSDYLVVKLYEDEVLKTTITHDDPDHPYTYTFTTTGGTHTYKITAALLNGIAEFAYISGANCRYYHRYRYIMLPA